jgi:hypothetical protein
MIAIRRNDKLLLRLTPEVTVRRGRLSQSQPKVARNEAAL